MAGELHRGEGLQEIAQASQAQGSFSFNEEDLRSLIQRWLDLTDNYGASIATADRMSRIKPPGDDFASEAHAAAANTSGTSYVEYLKANWQYCQDQAQLFQDALDDYLGVEHTNVADMDKNSRGV